MTFRSPLAVEYVDSVERMLHFCSNSNSNFSINQIPFCVSSRSYDSDMGTDNYSHGVYHHIRKPYSGKFPFDAEWFSGS